jgi:hypothetical protein
MLFLNSYGTDNSRHQAPTAHWATPTAPSCPRLMISQLTWQRRECGRSWARLARLALSVITRAPKLLLRLADDGLLIIDYAWGGGEDAGPLGPLGPLGATGYMIDKWGNYVDAQGSIVRNVRMCCSSPLLGS